MFRGRMHGWPANPRVRFPQADGGLAYSNRSRADASVWLSDAQVRGANPDIGRADAEIRLTDPDSRPSNSRIWWSHSDRRWPDGHIRLAQASVWLAQG
jgi:hypothetical protein